MTTTPHTIEPTRADEHTNDTASDLTTHVDVIEASMATITDILTTPTAELFHTHRTDIIRLLKTISHTDTLCAAFAYAAHEAGISRAAGTTRTSTYLARLLDTSEYQARQWINRGISLYKPPEPPKDNTDGDNTTDGEEDSANSDGDDDDTDDAPSRADHSPNAAERTKPTKHTWPPRHRHANKPGSLAMRNWLRSTANSNTSTPACTPSITTSCSTTPPPWQPPPPSTTSNSTCAPKSAR